MAYEKNRIKLPYATKSLIEGELKDLLLENEMVFATDTNEIAIKKGSDIIWISNKNSIENKIDLDEIGYLNHAAQIFYDNLKNDKFKDAWEHSLTVDPSEISADSLYASPRGKAQYPNGETEGIIIPEGVITIGQNAFVSSTSNNQPLVIPNSVTSIRNQAFGNWTANNQPLVIPDSVTSISNYAFNNWFANKHPLVIPSSVTSIGLSVFNNWLGAPYIEIQAITPPTLASSDTFNNQNDAPIYVPDESVNAYKTATNWVDLADRIFPISNKADLMNDIADLQENKQDKLVAGDNITIDPTTNVISASGGGGEVDPNAMAYFNYASSIYGDRYSLLANAWEHSLTVDPSEISVNSSSSSSNQRGTAQYPNGETEGVIIPQGVTNIGEYAFYNWRSNNHPLVIPNSVTSIGRSAFQNWQSNNHPLVIPASVTYIGEYAFYNWNSNNQPLVISNSVTSIGDYAFSSWNSNNQPLVIPDSVTSIGNYAFYYWSSNNQPLVIPNSVTSIGKSAFSSWHSVPYVEMKRTTPPTLSSSTAFGNQNNAPIYVPDESVDDYKSATNWVNLANRIFPISDNLTNLKGVVNDVIYQSNTHIMTFKRNEMPDIVIDLPIEALANDINNLDTRLDNVESSLGDIESALDAILGV